MKKSCSVIILIILFLSIGCNRNSYDYEGVKKVLKIRQHALESGDLRSYSSIISDHYFDNKKHEDKERILNKFRGIVANTKSRKINVSDVTVYFNKKGDHATVVEKIYIEVEMKNGEKKYPKNKEKIELSRENGSWKIVGGL